MDKKLVIGILAHVDAGKTTLTEGLLYQLGKLRKMGRVDHGDAFLDTHTLERERGITISCVADGKLLQFINPMDLYSLFGNALDNSIEAVEQFEEEEKRDALGKGLFWLVQNDVSRHYRYLCDKNRI